MEKDAINVNRYKRVFEQFKLHRPDVYKHCVGYEPRGIDKIRVQLDDGGYFDFTYINNYGAYVREKPKDRESITRDFVHNSFADNLRNMMDRRGFTQYTLSKATGISQGVISGYLRRNEAYDEHGQKRPVNPTIDKLYLIAWALDCEIYELL